MGMTEQNDTMTENQAYAAAVQAWEIAKKVSDEMGLKVECSLTGGGAATHFRVSSDDPEFEIELHWHELGPWLMGYQQCHQHQGHADCDGTRCRA